MKNTNTTKRNATQTIVVRERVVVEAEGKCTHGHRKPVACWKADGGEIRKFASMKDAAEALGVNHTAISYAVRHKKACRGYKICTLAEMDVRMDEMITDMNNVQKFIQIIAKNGLKMTEKTGKRNYNSQFVVCIEAKEVFSSNSDAARHFNTNPVCINQVLLGKAKTWHGMHFCYLSEYEETVRKLKEERIEAERKAEEERLEAIRKEEEKKRKEEEKLQRDIEKLEAKLKRRNEIADRLAAEYVRAVKLTTETEKELRALKEKVKLNDLQNNTN